MKPSFFTFSALLAIVVALSVTAHADATIPIFARSCSLCRMYGTPRSCTTYNRAYTQCNGMFFDSEATCVMRAGIYVSEPKEGCFMV
uniref:Kazal-like domain-containing protein n=1 Tax=Anopheles farauti TaxID=69004 RepID=A0A182R1E7_9DIPT